MKYVFASNATSVLCVLFLAACASAPSGGTASATPPQSPQQAGALPDPNADVSTIANELPGTLDGEIRRAQLLRSKGDYDDASRALAQLMLVAPDDPRVVGEYGKVLAQQGHPQQALPFLKRATELQPKEWTLYSALGVAYDQTDDHTDARLAYEHALQLAPGQAAVLNNFAVSRMLAGDLTGAQRLLAQASASGEGSTKIANNVTMLASLRAPAAPKTPSAGADAKPPASQKIASVNAEPKASVKPADHAALTPPKLLAPAIVMQAVPVDPLAGPVRPKAAPRARLASVQKPVPVAHAVPPPALRTAAEVN